MECDYCYGPIICPVCADESEVNFCHINCFRAHTREMIREKIEANAPLFTMIKEMPLGLRWANIHKLFYLACLKNSSTEQLERLKSKANEAVLDLLEYYSDRVKKSTMPETDYLIFSKMIKHQSEMYDKYILILGV